ncbi:DUF4269 domain-containing protein [Saccharibacillus sp. JS10]|uniref:DUF4269 domain-containing protein n=1 Tax=Saccharibacillus sp. JS10 TaxID=2950552 RepID=UPI00210AF00C|nr:DUF4269 domain-containing protein [Saccharibacillus sp. JS10]MCQ4085250.1 DUF4269 domain-containing protein [Saccharibacillus sp. JS10]
MNSSYNSNHFSDLVDPPTGEEGLRWLEQGSEEQQRIAKLLHDSIILVQLAAYSPSIAGTFPIGLNIPGSDIDILCEVPDFDEFLETCQTLFGEFEKFMTLHSNTEDGEACVIVRFTLQGIPIELFGQNKPVHDQNGCRHMIAERRLLALDVPAATEKIRQLKIEGLKTEPAFALFYGLIADPYNELYRLSEAPIGELKLIIAERPNF